MVLTGLICFFIGLGAGAWVMWRLILVGIEERCKASPDLLEAVIKNENERKIRESLWKIKQANRKKQGDKSFNSARHN